MAIDNHGLTNASTTHDGSGVCIAAVETMNIDPGREMPASIALGQEHGQDQPISGHPLHA
jgi:hypothetical protein